MLAPSQTDPVEIPSPCGKVLIYGSDAEMGAWAAARIGEADLIWPDDTVTIGIRRGAQLCGVALFNTFRGNGCCAHIATDGSKGWASRAILRALFSYPFKQCGLDRLTLPIDRQNVRSQVLALKLGFSFEGRLRQQNGRDEIILGMLKGECSWLRN